MNESISVEHKSKRLQKNTSVLDRYLAKPVYQAYAYSYPHKTSYRAFDKAINLQDVWQQEKLDSLFLYVHIPFCSMRCGFCNLFTLVKPQREVPDLYLDALQRQIDALKPIISQSSFARYAIGGGTPTYLSASQLSRLFEMTDFAGIADNTPIGIECSPETISAEKIKLLEDRGVDRISMGVQSFTETEIKHLVRRQNNHEVYKSLETIREYSQADLNLDLIYGIAGQTIQSWRSSLKQALEFKPEEFYLYPLYVRDKTGLGVIKDRSIATTNIPETDMTELYRVGRDLLISEGYQQVSMRMFRRGNENINSNKEKPPIYSCQEDGMLGLGAGARSYTKNLHYSSEYAVGRHGVREIIENYIKQSNDDFSRAEYGIKINTDEKKRRYVMQSLLISDGLDLNTYQQVFSSDCLEEFPLLALLIEGGLVNMQSGLLTLTEMGFERADSIGPWFASASVEQSMRGYKVR